MDVDIVVGLGKLEVVGGDEFAFNVDKTVGNPLEFDDEADADLGPLIGVDPVAEGDSVAETVEGVCEPEDDTNTGPLANVDPDDPVVKLELVELSESRLQPAVGIGRVKVNGPHPRYC